MIQPAQTRANEVGWTNLMCSYQAAERARVYAAYVRSDGEFEGTAERTGPEARGLELGLTRHSRPTRLSFFRIGSLKIPCLRDRKEEKVEEQLDVIGFLGSDGVLYCSQACAHRHGQSAGYEVDQDQYNSLLGEDSVGAGTICPGCGAEFPVEWPEREPS